MKRFCWILFFLSLLNLRIFAENNNENQKKSLIGAQIVFSNNVGTGMLINSKKSEPSFSSDLTLLPFLNIPGSKKSFKLGVEFNTGIEWLNKKGLKRNSQRQLNFSDIKLKAQVKNALAFSSIGLALTPSLSLEFPTSKSSTIANRFLGLQSSLGISLAHKGFFVVYKPGFAHFMHSFPYKSSFCDGTEDESSKLPNGHCLRAGRQTLFELKNGLSLGYNFGSHTFSAQMRLSHKFLRENNKEYYVEDKNDHGESYNESTYGMLEYNYEIPVFLPLILIAGISSEHVNYDPKTGFRVPFFDSHDPQHNLSTVYLGFDLTI